MRYLILLQSIVNAIEERACTIARLREYAGKARALTRAQHSKDARVTLTFREQRFKAEESFSCESVSKMVLSRYSYNDRFQEYLFSGYLIIVYVAILATTPCKSEKTNASTSADPAIVNHDEDEDDFVPYQGERISVFDWSLFKVTSMRFSTTTIISIVLKVFDSLCRRLQAKSILEMCCSRRYP